MIDWTMSLCKLDCLKHLKNHPIRERFALSLTSFMKFTAVNVNICRNKVGFLKNTVLKRLHFGHIMMW